MLEVSFKCLVIFLYVFNDETLKTDRSYHAYEQVDKLAFWMRELPKFSFSKSFLWGYCFFKGGASDFLQENWGWDRVETVLGQVPTDNLATLFK
jgi:hypothetical protein